MRKTLALLTICLAGPLLAGEPFQLDRCEILPLPGQQVALQIDGVEKTRWHFGGEYPRPFFYPFRGPAGTSLTRMGHPGAQNHDHHRSIWFAHKDVNGHDFWSDGKPTRVVQKKWYAYRDGNDEAIMATQLIWLDGDGRPLMQQDLVAALIPLDGDQHALEIQITVQPTGQHEVVQLGRTNFGLLAVRVAKSISAHFGGGRLTNSEGQRDEPNIFGQPARWMDYSGPVATAKGPDRTTIVEGITYFDHPGNPRYPTHWHVRQDGWMGASFCMQQGFTVRSAQPLRLRYLLHAHAGPYDHTEAQSIHSAFAQRPGFSITDSSKRHRQFEVARTD